METDNVVLEHLRAIRSKVDRIDDNVRELREEFISMRLREHASDGDDIRRDRTIAQLQSDVERIKRRLELVDD